MEVAIAGGHGQIGLLLTELLVEQGDSVRSLIRKAEQVEEIRELGAEPKVCDLEQADEEEVAAAIEGADAVVFAAGAGPGSGAERKWSMDYEGSVKLAAAAKRSGIDRYVMVSSMAADPDHEGDEVFDVYLRAKGKADAELAQSGLVYTIIRPGRLTDDEATGKVKVGESVGRGEIPRADVAAVIAASLRSEQTRDRAFEVISGEVPVAEALG